MESEYVEPGTKRANGYEYDADSRPSKQPRNDEKMTTRILLFGRYCGAVVGKGGETVKALRQKHKVQINGLNRFTDQRVLSLTGDRNNIISALKEILPVVALDAPYPSSTQQKQNFEINLLVNAGNIGAVIGKGGSKIKEITEVSSGKIQVHPDCLPKSNERVVAIGGNAVERIVDALDIIYNTLEGLAKKEEILYDPTEDSNIKSGGGSGGGQSAGMRPREQSIPMGNPIQQPGLGFGNQMTGGGQLGATYLNGSLGNVGGLDINAQKLFGQISANGQATAAGLSGLGNLQGGGMMGLGQQGMGVGLRGAPGYGQGAPGYGHQAQFGSQMNMNGANNNNLDFLQLQTKTEVTVSPEMCGAIIGKGGASIKAVKASTGVKMTVAGNEKGSKEDRTLTITGTQQQIQSAEIMITDCVRNYRK